MTIEIEEPTAKAIFAAMEKIEVSLEEKARLRELL